MKGLYHLHPKKSLLMLRQILLLVCEIRSIVNLFLKKQKKKHAQISSNKYIILFPCWKQNVVELRCLQHLQGFLSFIFVIR